ncbi:hypothetical protein [Burkholderia cenocepacia]|uniref:hypothetical protein n=1 Tax=Burkholderia cenocepacia TaxID=95486 RepID=UPI000760C987|nr:hypothetical protein [Burkholderia cenocepacia]KWU26334.1 hypothetical protein AS149_25430 [Burkholderia cenocepacia]
MDTRIARIVALTQYLGINYISENWASRSYPRTIKAVQTQYQGNVGTGLKVEWHPRSPDVLHVREQCTFDWKDRFSATTELATIFGEELVQDLEALAVDKARSDIARERDEELTRVAQQRMKQVTTQLQLEVLEAAAAQTQLTLI